MVPSPFALMRQRPKTSLFYLGITSSALWFTYDYTMTNDLMRSSCSRASSYGDLALKNPNAQPRHITVILNPVAGKRKSKKLYSKWVEPLLHLAGIKVSLVETQSPNQAYDLMKIMSNCDGVAIVGGDGTVHEVLNGLLNRPDSTQAVSKYPIGIIPTGQYNSIARYVHQGFITYRNQKEFLINATMKIVDSCSTNYDVLKISNLNEQTDETTNTEKQVVYALRDLRYGIYQDNFFKTSGYMMYQTYVRPYWLRLQRIFSRKYQKPHIESICYTEPCVGCSSCYNRHKLTDNHSEKVDQPNTNKRWWSVLAPVSGSRASLSEEQKKEQELAKRNNSNCGKWIEVGNLSDITDFRACMMGDKKVRLSLGRSREYEPSDVSEVQDVRLKVSMELDNAARLAEETKNKTKDEGSKDLKEEKEKDEPNYTKFLIDGQVEPARSVEVTAIDRGITVFTGHNLINSKSKS